MINHLRIQDIVARISGNSLRSTVKAQRALSSTCHALGEKELANQLDTLLSRSAEVNGHTARLHDLPGALNSAACDGANTVLIQCYSPDERMEAFRLLNCPFEKERASIEVQEYIQAKQTNMSL